MSTVTSRRTRPMRAQMQLPMMILIAVVGLLLVWWGGYEAAHAAGLSGTTGTVTVSSCRTIPQPKGSYIGCTGVFRSTDGRITDPAALVSSPEQVTAGHVFDVERNAPGDYGRISLQRTVGWFALLLFGLSMACMSPASLLGWRADDSPWAARAEKRFEFATLALFLGAAVFGVMAVVLSFTML